MKRNLEGLSYFAISLKTSIIKTRGYLILLLKRIFTKCGTLGLLDFLSDKTYVKIAYFLSTGKKLNLNNPVTFFDKINWLKIYYKNDLCSLLVDKYEFKNIVVSLIGQEYVVPTIGIYENFSDIDVDLLPNKFVIKCTHDSHSAILCKDKESFDFKKAEKKITKALSNNCYRYARERQYKNVKPRILIEELLELDGDDALNDYKRFCFDGVPRFMYIGKDASRNPTNTFFDMDFNFLKVRCIDPIDSKIPGKPVYFDKMKEIAALLSKDFPHARVDFYIVNNRLYVGEITFHHNGGLGRFYPQSMDEKFGSYLDISNLKKMEFLK